MAARREEEAAAEMVADLLEMASEAAALWKAPPEMALMLSEAAAMAAKAYRIPTPQAPESCATESAPPSPMPSSAGPPDYIGSAIRSLELAEAQERARHGWAPAHICDALDSLRTLRSLDPESPSPDTSPTTANGPGRGSEPSGSRAACEGCRGTRIRGITKMHNGVEAVQLVFCPECCRPDSVLEAHGVVVPPPGPAKPAGPDDAPSGETSSASPTKPTTD